MEYYQFNTYRFFHYCFRIPKHIPLRWGIIKEWSPAFGVKLRLGVILTNSLYIDVAYRKFDRCIDCGSCQRTIYPAHRISEGDYYHYYSETNCLQLVLEKTYILDIYRDALYDAERHR